LSWQRLGKAKAAYSIRTTSRPTFRCLWNFLGSRPLRFCPWRSLSLVCRPPSEVPEAQLLTRQIGTDFGAGACALCARVFLGLAELFHLADSNWCAARRQVVQIVGPDAQQTGLALRPCSQPAELRCRRPASSSSAPREIAHAMLCPRSSNSNKTLLPSQRGRDTDVPCPAPFIRISTLQWIRPHILEKF